MRECFKRNKVLPVTTKILLHNANCFFKLSFMYIELPVLKGDLVEEGSYLRPLHGVKEARKGLFVAIVFVKL